MSYSWRQTWDAQGKSDMLTHVLPFYLYDVHYSCGASVLLHH